MNIAPIPFHVDLNWVTLLATVVLPIVTALITSRLAASPWRAGVLALLTLVTTGLTELVQSAGAGPVDASVWLSTALTVFLGSVGLHFGLLKPTGITGADGAVQRAVPGGVGADITRDQDRPEGWNV